MPKLIISPVTFFLIIFKKPSTVSSIKVRSLVEYKFPNFIFFFPLSIWRIIVGIIALADCLGPYVLKGLIIETGVQMIGKTTMLIDQRQF